VPSSHALRLQSLIPGSRYAELKSGHAVFLEKPDELVSLVLPFLTDAPRPLS
jgi:pimeloyl-ACP methyl ester carboxylesterase